MQIKNMNETTIESQINELLMLEKELKMLLEEEQYEEFQQLEKKFSVQVKALIKNNSPESLCHVLTKLNQLENNIAELKERSEDCFEQLKGKFLLQKRNKNKIKAYK